MSCWVRVCVNAWTLCWVIRRCIATHTRERAQVHAGMHFLHTIGIVFSVLWCPRSLSAPAAQYSVRVARNLSQSFPWHFLIFPLGVFISMPPILYLFERLFANSHLWHCVCHIWRRGHKHDQSKRTCFGQVSFLWQLSQVYLHVSKLDFLPWVDLDHETYKAYLLARQLANKYLLGWYSGPSVHPSVTMLLELTGRSCGWHASFPTWVMKGQRKMLPWLKGRCVLHKGRN